MTRTLTKSLAVAALALLLARPAVAIELEPGEWQGTESGTENGEPAAPQTSTACISKADSRDLVKALTALKEVAGQKCATVDLHDEAKSLSFRIECGTPDKLSIFVDVKLTFENARHYSGEIKSSISLGGKTTSSDKQIDSRRIGPCKPE